VKAKPGQSRPDWARLGEEAELRHQSASFRPSLEVVISSRIELDASDLPRTAATD